eukprot:Nk52_evm1s1761 gene=Nk52_evmTU1s1761
MRFSSNLCLIAIFIVANALMISFAAPSQVDVQMQMDMAKLNPLYRLAGSNKVASVMQASSTKEDVMRKLSAYGPVDGNRADITLAVSFRRLNELFAQLAQNQGSTTSKDGFLRHVKLNLTADNWEDNPNSWISLDLPLEAPELFYDSIGSSLGLRFIAGTGATLTRKLGFAQEPSKAENIAGTVFSITGGAPVIVAGSQTESVHVDVTSFGDWKITWINGDDGSSKMVDPGATSAFQKAFKSHFDENQSNEAYLLAEINTDPLSRGLPSSYWIPRTILAAKVFPDVDNPRYGVRQGVLYGILGIFLSTTQSTSELSFHTLPGQFNIIPSDRDTAMVVSNALWYRQLVREALQTNGDFQNIAYSQLAGGKNIWAINGGDISESMDKPQVHYASKCSVLEFCQPVLGLQDSSRVNGLKSENVGEAQIAFTLDWSHVIKHCAFPCKRDDGVCSFKTTTTFGFSIINAQSKVQSTVKGATNAARDCDLGSSLYNSDLSDAVDSDLNKIIGVVASVMEQNANPVRATADGLNVFRQQGRVMYPNKQIMTYEDLFLTSDVVLLGNTVDERV